GVANVTKGTLEDRFGGLDRCGAQAGLELVGAVEILEAGPGSAREQRRHNGFVAFGRHLIGGVHAPILSRPDPAGRPGSVRERPDGGAQMSRRWRKRRLLPL